MYFRVCLRVEIFDAAKVNTYILGTSGRGQHIAAKYDALFTKLDFGRIRSR